MNPKHKHHQIKKYRSERIIHTSSDSWRLTGSQTIQYPPIWILVDNYDITQPQHKPYKPPNSLLCLIILLIKAHCCVYTTSGQSVVVHHFHQTMLFFPIRIWKESLFVFCIQNAAMKIKLQDNLQHLAYKIFALM